MGRQRHALHRRPRPERFALQAAAGPGVYLQRDQPSPLRIAVLARRLSRQLAGFGEAAEALRCVDARGGGALELPAERGVEHVVCRGEG